MNGLDMAAWKDKVCEVGRNLGRAKGMVKYHQCELEYCQTDNEADVLRDIISDWSVREAEQEEELDKLIGQLLLCTRKPEDLK